MNPSWTEVNAAVLAVLGSFIRPKASNGRATPLRSPQRRDVFVERLFALRHAEAIRDGSDEVCVLAGTVITPLARDLLKRRGMAIRVVSGREAEAVRGQGRGEWGFAIDSRSGQAEALRRLLLEGRDWAEVGDEAAAWVVDGEGRGAFVVADEASVATWRANRVEGIRAAAVCDPEAVTRAIRHLGANLIVVEPSGKSIYLLKQIGERFRQGGAPLVPEDMTRIGSPEGLVVEQTFPSAPTPIRLTGMYAPPSTRPPAHFENGVSR